MLHKMIILTLWAALLPTLFASLFHAIDHSILSGLLFGAAVAALPMLASALNKQLFTPRLFEATILIVIIVISFIVAYQISAPLLDGKSFSVESLLPLLVTTVALYMFYILLNRIASNNSGQSLMHRVESVLFGPPLLLTLAVAVIVATYIMIAIHNLDARYPDWAFFTEKFLERGIIPPLTVALFCWGLVILASKSYILLREKMSLAQEKRSLLLRAYHEAIVEERAGTPDIYIDLIWKKSADFYILPRYLNWAIPILGFIGTVYGISLAADGIQKIIGSQHGLTQLSDELSGAISPLGIAFDTTLIALSLSIILTLIQTILQRWENDILTACENHILHPNKPNFNASR